MDSDMEDFLISMIRRNPTNPNDKPWEKKGQQTKNSALSVQARNKGNELFKKSGHNEKTHMAILLHYTKSIALAIENSEEQALGYGNRSALLMHLGKYKKCLIDVTRALKITQSSDLKKKLLLRKEKCSASIKEEEDKAKNSNNLDQPLFTSPQDLAFYKVFSQKHLSSDKALKNKDYKEKTTSLDTEGFSKLKVPKITKANKKIPCFSDSITIEYNRKYGRHVVATRDIKPGEILVVDKGIVYPRANKIYLACSHCLNFAWNAVPCPTCIFVIYCSDKCKMDAWQEYHDVECSILPPLIAETSLDEHMMLVISALRLFLKFVKDEGLDDMIDQVKSLKNDKNAIINGFFTDGQFDSTKFRSYYNLLNENGNLKEERNSPIGPVAVLLLTKYSTVLGDFNYFKLDEKHEQIVKMIVSLETLIAKYSYPFQSFFCNCTDVKECALECPKILGSITTPSLNLFNHACFENANKVFCKDGKIIIYF